MNDEKKPPKRRIIRPAPPTPIPKKDPELEKMLGRIHEMREDLEKKIQHIESFRDKLPKKAQEILDVPESMGEKRYARFLEKRREMEDKLISVVGKGFFKKREEKKKKEEQKARKKGRKAQKLRGKKNWLSMD